MLQGEVWKMNQNEITGEMLQYWFHQFMLSEKQREKCFKCKNYGVCWAYDGAVFNTKCICSLCKDLQIISAVKSIQKIGLELEPVDFETYIKLEKLLKLSKEEKIQLRRSKERKYIGCFRTGASQEKRPFYIAFCSRHQIYYLSYHNSNCPICRGENMKREDEDVLFNAEMLAKTLGEALLITMSLWLFFGLLLQETMFLLLFVFSAFLAFYVLCLYTDILQLKEKIRKLELEKGGK